ncbi:hypothetical protein [Roseibium limicola]|uniref:Uncharacterized protein n=1 Tax=Roseibium limicola TaxID=2816037 RepID=A0A939J9X3_9HYPH|nr:hypothetical protein [Roseibium limicola]MBO0345848.1 hypothetical protein [Roseibium limicola]
MPSGETIEADHDQVAPHLETPAPPPPASAAAIGKPPSDWDIKNALISVLQSDEFSGVPQLRTLLSYIVKATLEERTHDLKGYTIAVEALGRNEDFDPVTNPIVRVEASRLRRRLAAYYSGPGSTDPVRITIPKGTYVPRFEVLSLASPELEMPEPEAPETLDASQTADSRPASEPVIAALDAPSTLKLTDPARTETSALDAATASVEQDGASSFFTRNARYLKIISYGGALCLAYLAGFFTASF